MFLALGVGAWTAALFHFMTHACFKALLFLAAGAVILSLHHEHDIFRMGGLWRRLPVAFITFLIGSASLAGLPLITAGFYSKDMILWQARVSAQGSIWLWVAGLVGALLTSLYIFRVVFRVFFGPLVTPVEAKPGGRIGVVLIILAILSIGVGWLDIPGTFGVLWPSMPDSWRHLTLFTDIMHTALPPVQLTHSGMEAELTSQIVASAIALIGLLLALGFLRRPRPAADAARPTWWLAVRRLWFVGWGFDVLYDTVIVRPFVWLAQANRDDGVNALSSGTAWLSASAHHLLSRTQTGRVRGYAASIAAGAVILIALMVWL
jgi:NADH-quinone oxidoreductase subunit L